MGPNKIIGPNNFFGPNMICVHKRVYAEKKFRIKNVFGQPCQDILDSVKSIFNMRNPYSWWVAQAMWLVGGSFRKYCHFVAPS